MKALFLDKAVGLALAAGLMGIAPGARATDLPPDAQPSAWIFKSGLELGKSHNQGFMANLDYSGRAEAGAEDARYWTFGVSGLRTKARTSSNGIKTDSVTTDGGIYTGYGTARIRGHLGFDAAHQQDLRRSQQISGGIDLARNGWSATLEASHRRTDFVNFTVSPEVAALVGVVLPTAGPVACSISDRGIGAKFGYEGQTWSAYAGGMWNSYKNADCAFDITAVQNANFLDAVGLQTLSGNFLDRAIARAGGRIGRQAQLLKSDMNLGFSHMWGSTNVMFDYGHSKDEFGQATQSDYQLTGSHPVGTNVLLDLALGTTIANSKKTPYLGLFVTVGL